MRYAIGIDLGGTNVKAVAVAPDGAILRTDRFETEDGDRPAWLTRVPEYIRRLESELGPARDVGVASPGLAARDGRSIAWMQGRMAAVQGLDWTNHLRRSCPVPVANDAHAALLGETWLGAAKGATDAVLLTLGTGVGGAILCDGRLLKGHLGRAGHLGHISLDADGSRDIVNTPGSLEEAIGDCTLSKRSGGKFDDTKVLIEAAKAGDDRAKQIWLTSVKALAAGMVSIINAVDPEVIILGGGIAKAERALTDPLDSFLDQFEWRPTGKRVRLVQATLGDLAGALGAARNAMETENGSTTINAGV